MNWTMTNAVANPGRFTRHPRNLPPDPDGYLNAHEAAAFLGVTIGTLAQWRHHNRYKLPAFRLGTGKRGGRCFYRRRDLIAFMEAQFSGQEGPSEE